MYNLFNEVQGIGMSQQHETVWSLAPTREVMKITEKEQDKKMARKADPRFARPETRAPIKEDSGTYSIIYKRK